jgi:hypothetical protein
MTSARSAAFNGCHCRFSAMPLPGSGQVMPVVEDGDEHFACFDIGGNLPVRECQSRK